MGKVGSDHKGMLRQLSASVRGICARLCPHFTSGNWHEDTPVQQCLRQALRIQQRNGEHNADGSGLQCERERRSTTRSGMFLSNSQSGKHDVFSAAEVLLRDTDTGDKLAVCDQGGNRAGWLTNKFGAQAVCLVSPDRKCAVSGWSPKSRWVCPF